MEIICVLIVPIIFFGDLWLKNRVEKGLFVRENKKERALLGGRLDRKSTRLNSSH